LGEATQDDGNFVAHFREDHSPTVVSENVTLAKTSGM